MNDTPRIYAACLASYNSGILHGAWIDCDEGAAAIWSGINAMLAKSPEPNTMRRICDHCGAYQTRTDYDRTPENCPTCGAIMPEGWFPSAEEWAIHDHENFCGTISSEWPNIDDLALIAEALEGNHRLGFLYLANEIRLPIAEAADRADEVCIFQSDAHDLLEDYAYDLASETIPDFERLSGQWPYECIDWADAGRTLATYGDVTLCDLGGERFLVTNASEF